MGCLGSFKENFINLLQDYGFKFAPNYDQTLFFLKKRITGKKNITSFLVWNFNEKFENSQIIPLIKQILHGSHGGRNFIGYFFDS